MSSNEIRRKKRLQIWIEPDLDEAIGEVLATYRENGKRVEKTAIVERLIRDGFKFWSREDQVSNRVERTLAAMADNVAMARAMQNALAYIAVGQNDDAYAEYLAEVARRKEEIPNVAD